LLTSCQPGGFLLVAWLELVRDLEAAGGLLTSEGTVYPLLNRLAAAGLVTSEWRDEPGERPRRYYAITDAGLASLAAFQVAWTAFARTVSGVLDPTVPFGGDEVGPAWEVKR